MEGLDIPSIKVFHKTEAIGLYCTNTKTETERPGVNEYIYGKVVHDTSGIVNQWGNSSVNSNWIPVHKSQIQNLDVKGSPAVQYQKTVF